MYDLVSKDINRYVYFTIIVVILNFMIYEMNIIIRPNSLKLCDFSILILHLIFFYMYDLVSMNYNRYNHFAITINLNFMI